MIKAASVVIALTLLTTLAQAQGLSLGFGASGGLNVPLAQDDQGSGTALSLRAMLRAARIFGVEAHVDFARYGDPEVDVAGITNDLEGSKVTSYGLAGFFGGGPGMGIHPFLLAGVGFFDTSRDQTAAFDEDGSEFGYTAGVGIGFGFSPTLGLELRGRMNIIPTEGSSSDKSIFVLGGLNYYLGK